MGRQVCPVGGAARAAERLYDAALQRVASKWGCVWQPLATASAGGATDAAGAAPLECLEHLIDVWLVKQPAE